MLVGSGGDCALIGNKIVVWYNSDEISPPLNEWHSSSTSLQNENEKKNLTYGE